MSTKNFLEISSLRAAKEVRFATKRIELYLWHTSSKRLKYRPNLDGALLKCFEMVSLSFS